jgi:hypothetical protein
MHFVLVDARLGVWNTKDTLVISVGRHPVHYLRATYSSTGYQLSDQILLRVEPQTQRAAGLTVLNFSVHAHTTYELPLPGIEEDPEVKPALLQILSSPPVAHFLRVVEGKQGVSAILLRPLREES